MKILKNIFKSEAFLIALFYSLAYGITIFNDGLFIDDWCLYKVAKPAIMALTKAYGNPWDGYVFTSIFSFNTLVIPKLMVFSLFLFSAFLLNGAIKGLKAISSGSRLAIVLLFAVFPVNFIRIALCSFKYTLSYFAFFLGLWFFVRYLRTRSIAPRAASLFLFFMSFTTSSVLVLYAALILLLIVYTEGDNIGKGRELAAAFFRYADFLVIGPIFWIVRTALFKQTDIYTAYNHITLRSVILTPLTSLQALNDSFIAVVNNAFAIFLSNICLSLIFGFTVLLLLSKTAIFRTNDKEPVVKLFLSGLFLFLAAVFPYLAVDHIPRFFDWDSRNQLLVPLGASLMLYYGLRIVFDRFKWSSRARLFLYSILIALFISLNFKVYVDYQKDWFKQLSLVENFKSSDIMKNGSTFIFDDQTTEMNTFSRFYRFYEYTGLMKLAFGDESRFGIGLDAYNKLDWSKYFINNRSLINSPQYNISGYKPENPDFRVVIKPGSHDLSRIYKVLRMMYYKISDPVKFKEAVAGIVKLEYVKL